MTSEIKVLATTAMKTSLDELTSEFTRATGTTLSFVFGPSARIAKMVADGEAHDVAIVTDHGHDGVIEKGRILNEATIERLVEQGLMQARAGCDILAPSDMMDGRVGALRAALDERGLSETPLIAYSAKFASAFYGPFREAADSAPQSGDSKGYQMDPANALEAVREAQLDVDEGADIVMVKPALPYLDVILRKEVEIGIQQLPELMAVPGIDIVGPLPPDVQMMTVFSAGLSANAKNVEGANALIHFLTTPKAVAVIKAKGMEVG